VTQLTTTFNRQDIAHYLHEKDANNVTNSANTTRSYRTKLMAFLEFSHGLADNSVALSYRDTLSCSRDSDQVKQILYVLSDFFRSLGGCNPFYELSRAYRTSKKESSIKRAERDERVLSSHDVDRMLMRARQFTVGHTGVDYYVAYRNFFMIQMMAKYGMRVTGLVGIDLDHIDTGNRKLIIRSSKNQVPYPVPIVDSMSDIRGYLNIRNQQMSTHTVDHDALLLSKTGRRLSDTSARRAINAVSESLGLYEPQRSTHQLRHYRATRYYKRGMATQLISSIMGMSEQTLRTTYLHLTDQDTVDEYEAWSRDRKRDGVVCPRCGYDGTGEDVDRVSRKPELRVV